MVVGLPRGKLDRFSLSPVIADDEASFAFRGKATSAAFLPPGDYEAFFLETKDPFHTPSVRLLAAQGGLALKAHQRQRLRFGRLRSGGRSELRGTLQAALLAGSEELAAIRSSGDLYSLLAPRVELYDQGGLFVGAAYASLPSNFLPLLAQALESGDLGPLQRGLEGPREYRIGGLAAGRYRLNASAYGHGEASKEIELKDDQPARWDPVLVVAAGSASARPARDGWALAP